MSVLARGLHLNAPQRPELSWDEGSGARAEKHHQGREAAGLFLGHRQNGFFLHGRGGPDFPAESRDSEHDEDDQQDQAPDVLRDIDPDREVHAVYVVENADEDCHNKEEDGADNDSKDGCGHKPQRIWFLGLFCHKVHKNPFGIKP